MSKRIKIEKVWIEHKVDESPDLSSLGSYHSKLDGRSNEFTIDRDERDDRGREQHRYFTPGSVEKYDVAASWLTEAAEKAIANGESFSSQAYWEKAMKENAEQDYSRMEAYNRGDWQMLGVIAKAEIRNPVTGVSQVVRSGGLWGVESDSGDYLIEVAKDELAALRLELEALGQGISARAIAYAFKAVDLKGGAR